MFRIQSMLTRAMPPPLNIVTRLPALRRFAFTVHRMSHNDVVSSRFVHSRANAKNDATYARNQLDSGCPHSTAFLNGNEVSHIPKRIRNASLPG